MSKAVNIRPPSGQPLIVEIIPETGVGGRPLILPIRQIVVRHPNGTPIAIVAQFGPDGSHAVSHVGDDDFNRILRNLALDISHVQVDTIQMPPPQPGARLVAGPKAGE